VSEWLQAWDQFDYGPYGPKACNLCHLHLYCRKETEVYARMSVTYDPENPPYCENFSLSREIEESLISRGFWDRVKENMDKRILEEWKKQDPYLIDTEGYMKFLEQHLAQKWYTVHYFYESALDIFLERDFPLYEKIGYKVKIEKIPVYISCRACGYSFTLSSQTPTAYWAETPLDKPIYFCKKCSDILRNKAYPGGPVYQQMLIDNPEAFKLIAEHPIREYASILVKIDKPLPIPKSQNVAKICANNILGIYTSHDYPSEEVIRLRKIVEEHGFKEAVKHLKERHIGGGGSINKEDIPGSWTNLEYMQGKGIWIEIGPPAYPTLRFHIQWDEVVAYALDPRHHFKVKVTKGKFGIVDGELVLFED